MAIARNTLRQILLPILLQTLTRYTGEPMRLESYYKLFTSAMFGFDAKYTFSMNYNSQMLRTINSCRF